MNEYYGLASIPQNKVRLKILELARNKHILNTQIYFIDLKLMYIDYKYFSMSDSELAERYNMREEQVYSWRRKNKLPKNENVDLIDSPNNNGDYEEDYVMETIRRRREMVREGYTFKEIIEEQGISRRGLRDWIVRNGLADKVRGFE